MAKCRALVCKKCKDFKCDSLENETCAVDVGSKQAACLTYVYKDANKTQVTEKRCISFDKGDTYECSKAQVEKISCTTCTEDFCNNSGWRSSASALFYISLLAPLLLLKVT
ncbi:hypothetical protein Zmor_023384 [Zophobas morio]|uniref:Uncharacterized protein n=1 Tax=Zophobas morio TaxID=2755281 RepID=A0AA38I2Z5_9CUCU|nr:hypothetical protein Zmor_023384 [Zophobas morio]